MYITSFHDSYGISVPQLVEEGGFAGDGEKGQHMSTCSTAQNRGFHYPAWSTGYVKIAIEIVDLPMNSMVIFHSSVNVYQRVSSIKF